MTQRFTDEAMITGLRQTNSALTDAIVAHLYRQFLPRIAYMVIRNSGTTADAEDLFQETLVLFLDKVLKDKFELRGNTQLETYFYALAHNGWLRELHRRKMQGQHETAFMEKSARQLPEDTPETAYLDQEEEETSWHMFKQLDQFSQDILTAYYRDKQSMEQIATQFGLGNSNNAKTIKYRCIQKLKAILS